MLSQCWFPNWLLYTELSKDRSVRKKTQATPHWEMAVLINKGTYHEAGHGCCRMSRSPHPSARTFQVCVEALTDCLHVNHPGASSNTMEWMKSLWNHPGVLNNTLEWLRSLWLPGPSSRASWWSHSLDDFLQHSDMCSSKLHSSLKIHPLHVPSWRKGSILLIH